MGTCVTLFIENSLLLLSFSYDFNIVIVTRFFQFLRFSSFFSQLKGQPWSNGSCCRWNFSLPKIGQHSFWIGREHPRTRRRSFQRCRLLIKIRQESPGSIRINPMTHQFLNWGQKILADYCCMNLAGFFFFQVFLFNHFEFFVIDTSIDKLLKTSVIAKPQPPTFVELRSISFVRSIHNSYFFPPLLITSFFRMIFRILLKKKKLRQLKIKSRKP